MKKNAIVWDIDNTLLDTRHLFEQDSLDYFYEHCNDDDVPVIDKAKNFLDTLNHSQYYKRDNYLEDGTSSIERLDYVTILLTARNEHNREATEDKLADAGIGYDYLLMRADDDFREPPEVKRDYLIKLMEEYDIVAFIDDDSWNCAMARDLGLLALMVV